MMDCQNCREKFLEECECGYDDDIERRIDERRDDE